MDFLRPDKGQIEILGLDSQRDSRILKGQIGFLSEGESLHRNWTGQEHIDLIKKIRGIDTEESKLIEKLDFNPKKIVKSLSSGNRQKLGIILALICQSKLLLLDEPTRGLDPLLKNSIHRILKSEARKGKAILMSSHDLADVEQICDRVVIIKEGQIITNENISQLAEKRLYTISLFFKEKLAKEKIEGEGVEIKKELPRGFLLNYRGEIETLLDKIGKFGIRDIEIKHASLEEIFLKFYK